MFRPSLRLGYHHLRETIGSFMCLDRNLAISSKDINGLENALVNILNKLLNWLLQYASVLARDRTVVVGWEIGNARCSLCLLPSTIALN